MISSATNWRPDEILDHMTWQDVHDLVKGWRKHPPLQRMFQDYLLTKGLKYAEPEPETDDADTTGAWFHGLDQDEFMRRVNAEAATLAQKLH